MKKILIISSIVSLLILGCGSGSSNGDSENKKSIDGALKIGDVVYSAPTGVNFKNKMRTTLNKTTHKTFKNFKTEVEDCLDGGTARVEESGTDYSITFNECIEYNEETALYEYYHGMISESNNGETLVTKEYWYIPNIDEFYTGSYMDLVMDFHENGNILETKMHGDMVEFVNDNITEDSTFNNLVIKEDSSNNSIYLSGSYTYKAGCINESYSFDTSEWLVINSNNEDEYISGKIIVNGMTYIYNGDRVTVKYQGKEGDFSQRELNEAIENQENSTECGTRQIDMN